MGKDIKLFWARVVPFLDTPITKNKYERQNLIGVGWYQVEGSREAQPPFFISLPLSFETLKERGIKGVR